LALRLPWARQRHDQTLRKVLRHHHQSPRGSGAASRKCAEGCHRCPAFFANMAVVLATSIFALDFVPQARQKFAFGFLAVIIIVSIVMIVQAAVMRLSSIDERLLCQFRVMGRRISITPAVLMKLVLIIINFLVFVEMASGISVRPDTSE
jgi:hypothetical protein